MQAFSNSLVLVVDDTPENITTVSMLLQDICEVAAATNGQEALDLAAATSPDLILLDVLMPEMDGFATCRKLKENPETASIPVIFVTTLDSPEDKLEGFAVGAVDYITKPFHAGEIRARVRTQLRIRKLEQHILQYQQFVAGEKKEFDSGSKFSEKFNQIFVCAEADDAVNFLNTAWVNLT
ncbi:MAG: response regulator, partial [Chthoniobacterales bacterium]|nr:response regulator [Chthoniobacterales bacterium]